GQDLFSCDKPNIELSGFPSSYSGVPCIVRIGQGYPPERIREVSRGRATLLWSFRRAVNVVVVLRCSIRGKAIQSFRWQRTGAGHDPLGQRWLLVVEGETDLFMLF